MSQPLTPEQAKIIKATVPVLAEHGLTITTKFYRDMINAHPELKNMFNKTHQETGHQPAALAGSLYAYASNIDDLGKLSPAVELICHKHVSLYLQPEQYSIVGHHLIETLKAVLGDAATPDIIGAWGAAYWQLANIMIDREAELYKQAKGWTDWKDFTIVKKEKESEEITSFYFKPVDQNLVLPIFKPGQYISAYMFVEELDGGVWQARQYSLSDAPGRDYLRISVKKEPGVEIGEPKHLTHPGYLSTLLHETKKVGDTVRLSHPFGDFFFSEKEEDKESPVVLISAGVGLTCLTSILNTLTENYTTTTKPITWIQGARNSAVRAFKTHIDSIATTHKNVIPIHFSSEPHADEVEGTDYTIKGRVNLDKVSKEHLHTDNNRTQYYVCGPTQFMLDVESKLQSYGVAKERINMELFGTGGVPRV